MVAQTRVSSIDGSDVKRDEFTFNNSAASVNAEWDNPSYLSKAQEPVHRFVVTSCINCACKPSHSAAHLCGRKKGRPSFLQ